MSGRSSTDQGSIYYNPKIVLGRGQFGTVYKGRFQNREVAVKVITTAAVGDKEALAERNVLLLTSKAPHKNILQCFHIHQEEEYIKIALELCQSNLKDWVSTKGECIRPAVIHPLKICSQIIAGIKYLHDHNIVHRDLKPPNILLYMSPEHNVVVKVADFGLCKIIPDDRSCLTMTTASGTPGWMAAEVIKYLEDFADNGDGKPKEALRMTRAMDIFSLGCLLYYILTAGQHPFGTSALSRGANILQDSPIIVEDINFPKEFQLIRLMLSGDPKRRPRIDETLCVFSQHLADTNAQIPGNLIVANKEEVSTEDLVTNHGEGRNIPYARITGGTMKIDRKPIRRVPLCIPCPGKNCNSAVKFTWKCKECQASLVWGLDHHVYCNCGKTAAKFLEFKCIDKRHGIHFESHDEQDLIALLDKLQKQPELNLLLLGECGVGKSTWINAFLNYVRYESLDEAVKHDLVSLIPTQFTVENLEFEMVSVSTGNDKNEAQVPGQSTTQAVRIFQVNFEETTVNLIDTPGIGDARGVDQDNRNFENILSAIGNFDELHGICIFLKPNAARLNAVFRYCIKGILTNLHRDASKNIIFCFTNTRNTFYRPGDTFRALRKLLGENKEVEIKISKETIYCFDSEAYRYLAAVKNIPTVTYSDDEKENFTRSWLQSISEIKRMMAHIRALKPHAIQDTQNLSHARKIVLALAQPLAEISRNIYNSKTMIQAQTQDIEKFNVQMGDPIFAVTMQKMLRARNQLLSEYEYELSVLQQSSVKFACFLEKNAITPYNDGMKEYIKQLIMEEKMAHGGNIEALNSLEEHLAEHVLRKEIYENGLNKKDVFDAALNPAEISELVKTLKCLNHSGKSVQEKLDGIFEKSQEEFESSVIKVQLSYAPNIV